MSVVDFVFNSVGGRALSSLLKLVATTDIFHHFFLRFQYNHLQIFLPTATSVKILSREFGNIYQIYTKWKYILSTKTSPKTKTFSLSLLYGKSYRHRRLGYYFDRQGRYLKRVEEKRAVLDV